MPVDVLRGKTVLVTGGAKNLGGAVSRDLAAAGANRAVHYHSHSDEKLADDTVAACVAAGGDAFAIQADLTSVPEIRMLRDGTSGRRRTSRCGPSSIGARLSCSSIPRRRAAGPRWR